MIYNGSDRHKIALFEGKQDKLTAGDNISLTPLSDGTVRIDADGGATNLDDLGDVDAESPENGQALVYDEEESKWVPGEAGQVDDVQMNGQSIVHNKVASFNNYVELTQSEYDALPASKLTDGVLYCIKDDGIVEGDKFAPVIYSLEEREVGVWTDGKPLYARTFTSKFINDSGTYKADISCDFSAVDKVVYSKAQFLNSTASSAIPYYAVGSDLIYYWYSKTDNKIYVRATTDRTAYDVNVTLYYTKTTDVPGSGTWGTDGVPMVHYDGTERIIGTWFGETLYEKTYDLQDISNNYELDVSALNIKYLVDKKGTYRRYRAQPYLEQIDALEWRTETPSLNNYGVNCKYNVGTKKFNFFIGGYKESGDTSIITVKLTIQYTKTT